MQIIKYVAYSQQQQYNIMYLYTCAFDIILCSNKRVFVFSINRFLFILKYISFCGQPATIILFYFFEIKQNHENKKHTLFFVLS